MPVQIKRVYDKPAANDGVRVLVDGLWPRGISKENLEINDWVKEIAPSSGLRRWYAHDPKKWPEFRKRYQRELAGLPQKALLKSLAERARKGMLTLVFSARDGEHSNAAALAEMIRKRI